MFALVGLVAPLFSLAFINVKWPVVLGACLYAMTGLYFALRDGERTALRFVPMLLLLYLVMHAGYGIGMWVEIFRPTGRRARGPQDAGTDTARP
jgi:VIT1/CCC1 family predicted Fe2+/Mn2+ transporter